MKRFELNQPDYAIAASFGPGVDSIVDGVQCVPLYPKQDSGFMASTAFDAYLHRLDMSMFSLWKDSAHLGGVGGHYRKGYIVRLSYLRSQRHA